MNLNGNDQNKSSGFECNVFNNSWEVFYARVSFFQLTRRGLDFV